MKRTWNESRLFQIWQASAVVLLTCLIWRLTMLVGDGYWYIALGRWIRQTGDILPVDPFSFASSKSPYMPHMIGCDLGFSWIEEHFGPKSLITIVSLLSTIAWLIPWLFFSKSRPSRMVTFYLLAAWCAWLGFRFTHFGVRGQVFGDLGVAILLACLFRMREGWRPPFWLPIALVAVWVNCHPSFLLALVAPLGFWMVLRLDPRSELASPKPFLLFSLYALAATGFSFYSFRFLPEAVHLFSGRTTAFVDVQRPPVFRSWIMPISLAATFLVIAARTLYGPARFRRSDVALLLAGLLVSLLARRHASLLAVLMTIETALLLNTWKPRKSLTVQLCLGLTVLNLGLSAWSIASKTTDDHPFYSPRGAETFLASTDFPDRLFNPYHWGGYLDYQWNGHRKVFIDGRNTLYGNQVLDDYLEIRQLGPDWQRLLDLYEIQTILWESGTKLDEALTTNDAWQEVYRDKQAVIFFRRAELP